MGRVSTCCCGHGPRGPCPQQQVLTLPMLPLDWGLFVPLSTNSLPAVVMQLTFFNVIGVAQGLSCRIWLSPDRDL